MRSSPFIRTTPAELDQYLKKEARDHAQAITDLLTTTGLSQAPWTIHIEMGEPNAVVPALVAKNRITLLVMGTVARTGIPGLVMGNTAERILDEVRCSVIAVKPPGFISPLTSDAERSNISDRDS